MSEQHPPQQPPWGPPPPGYGPPGYGYGPPVPPPGYYASFGQRVVATLWDIVYLLPAWGVQIVGVLLAAIGIVMNADEASTTGVVLIVVGVALLAVGTVLAVWLLIKNVILRQGRTGYTWGKARVGIRCILEINGQPSGVGNAVARYFLHAVINQACYIDYLWAAWDDRHQTLTDKLLKTVVVNQPEGANAR